MVDALEADASTCYVFSIYFVLLITEVAFLNILLLSLGPAA